MSILDVAWQLLSESAFSSAFSSEAHRRGVGVGLLVLPITEEKPDLPCTEERAELGLGFSGIVRTIIVFFTGVEIKCSMQL